MKPMQVGLTCALGGREVSVGTVWLNPRAGGDLSYSSEWLAHPDAFALAPSAPLAAGQQHLVAGPGQLPAVLSDSAPDRWGRRVIQRQWRASRGVDPREADYLLAVNDRTRMGALRYWVDGEAQSSHSRTPKVLELAALEEAARRFQQDRESDDDLMAMLRAGSSLGGARPKAVVQDDAGRLQLAKFTAVGDERWVVAWEKVCLDIAAAAGIRVPTSRLMLVAGRPVLLLDRFDRRDTADGRQRRVPYMSAMTLLNQTDGSASSMVEIAEEFQPLCGAGLTRDLNELWDRAALNLLVGNRDNHLRNHGFIHEDGTWTLAPAFDITPDTSKADYAVAVDVTGEDTVETLLAVSELFELDRADATDRLRRIVDCVDQWRQLARLAGIPAEQDRGVRLGFEGPARDEARQLLG